MERNDNANWDRENYDVPGWWWTGLFMSAGRRRRDRKLCLVIDMHLLKVDPRDFSDRVKLRAREQSKENPPMSGARP